MKISVDTTFNRMMKKWREERGLTHIELSELTGFSVHQIMLYESEKQSLSYKNLKLFADKLGFETDQHPYKQGNIIMTEEQKETIQQICESNRSVQEKYDTLCDVFDITWKESYKQMLLDDMDIGLFSCYGPDEMVFTDDGSILNRNTHSDIWELYVLCHGGTYGDKQEDEAFHHELNPPRNLPLSVSHRRTSKHGFITEQRRQLLALLIQCFKRDEEGMLIFDLQTFKKEIGW